MRTGHFEELAPVCPRCLHGREALAPLTLAHVAEEAAGHVVHGILHCSDRDCWMEFPILDGVPVIVPDPRAYLSGSVEHVAARDDLPAVMGGMIGETLPFTAGFNTARYHLSLYCNEHYGDWSGREAAPQVTGLMETGAELAGIAQGPALDLGCGTGRGAYALAELTGGKVIGADLSFPMMRFAQRLLIRGEARWPRRKVGLVYAEETATLPEDAPAGQVDFWALDAMALPFPAGRFGAVTAVNLLDCIAGPTNMLSELARVLAPGAPGFLTTPYDWSEQATAVEHWLGGHSQRAETGGESGPPLRATLAALGLSETASRDGMPWKLTVHERSTTEYRLEMIAFRRAAAG